MKFRKEKLNGIMEVEVRHTCSETVHGHEFEPFQIVATKNGVYVTGRSPILKSVEDLHEFARAVGESTKDYLMLKKCGGIVTHANTTQ